jgi:uncharacterized protein YcbK (DUF882 family)
MDGYVASKNILSRRGFLRLMLWAGVISCSSKSAFAAIDAISSDERSLALYNPRTKESFKGVYWRNGDFVAGTMKNIYHIMRDTRTDEIKQIDPDLLDLIFKISIKLESKAPFHVISGYRSRKTNDLLLKRNKCVAKNSYHTRGQALDIHLPGLKTTVLRRAAYELKKGGIGYYPRRGVVHIDIGPVRYWRA